MLMPDMHAAPGGAREAQMCACCKCCGHMVLAGSAAPAHAPAPAEVAEGARTPSQQPWCVAALSADGCISVCAEQAQMSVLHGPLPGPSSGCLPWGPSLL
jgi:hypothetical protein